MTIDNVIFNADLEDILEELISQLRLNDIQYMQKVKDAGDNIQVCCPYHKGGMERRPSAGIRKSDGLLHCLACGETHTLPEVVSHCFGKDDIGAFGWKWLLKNFATVQVEERDDVKLDFVRNGGIDTLHNLNINSGSVSNTGRYVSEEELDSYRYIHPYMYKRKLTDEIIEIFDIGYDAATESITFPVKDINGNCVFVARRSVKTKWFNYPQGAEKPLYGLYELYHGERNLDSIGNGLYQYSFPDEIIVCESMLDALTCWVYGKYAVALNGLGNDLQFKQLRELPCRKLILATDADERGMAARERIRRNMQNTKIITEYVWDLSEAKDINDMSREMFLSLKEIF